MSVAILTVSFLAFVVFIIPIMVDYNVLQKYADRKFVKFYTIIKTLIYIAYPLFIVAYLNLIIVGSPNPQWRDYSVPATYNQSTIEFMAMFLLVVGFMSLLIAKYLVLSSINARMPIAKLFIEILYFPFIVAAMLIALW